MFSLTTKPNSKVTIDGVHYELLLSFDNVLLFLDMLKDDELSDAEQVILGLQMLTGEEFDMPLLEQEKVLSEIFDEFIATDDTKAVPLDIKGNPMPMKSKGGSGERTYCFRQDAAYIYASFLQDYKIDLIEEQGKLHWRQFIALFEGLSSETKLKQVIEIRTMEVPKGKGTEKQRKQVLDAKAYYKLDDD